MKGPSPSLPVNAEKAEEVSGLAFQEVLTERQLCLESS